MYMYSNSAQHSQGRLGNWVYYTVWCDAAAAAAASAIEGGNSSMLILFFFFNLAHCAFMHILIISNNNYKTSGVSNSYDN